MYEQDKIQTGGEAAIQGGGCQSLAAVVPSIVEAEAGCRSGNMLHRTAYPIQGPLREKGGQRGTKQLTSPSLQKGLGAQTRLKSVVVVQAMRLVYMGAWRFWT